LFLFGEPSEGRISDFLESQRDSPFSYGEVGASREGGAPAGYAVDHNHARLGEGKEAFDRAVAALRAWKMFDVGWVRVFPPRAPVEVGTAVAVVGRHHGFSSLNACRIVYLIDEDDGGVRRRGFAYGTLPEHAERGEERFTVEWRREDDSVHYDLFAFSRPNQFLSRIGHPLARRLQRRFARGSLRAMVRATASAFPPREERH
jgi:uncharacterized protein (UPF0548 family)